MQHGDKDMENKIQIFNSQELGVQAVSARVLYSELVDGDMSNYSRWVKKNIVDNDYADNGCDYITRHSDEYSGRGQKATDYVLTIDFAKELCMMSKCEKGKVVRKYFIDCEKKLKQQSFLPDFNNPAEAARAWADQYEKSQKLLSENKAMKPKADFYDTVANIDRLLSMDETAKVLDMGIGRNNLFKILRDKKILMNNNVPYQRYINLGYFKSVERTTRVDNVDKMYIVTFVKQKGLDYIRKLLVKDGYRCKNTKLIGA